MRVYFSGISGTGIGPLAEFAQDAGCDVCGSDLARGAISKELAQRNLDIFYGEQDGNFLREMNEKSRIDWFVYSSALPADHAELALARELGIKCSKRDEFISALLREKDLQMLAIAGTHGKTTTVSMAIWAFRQLNISCSYLVGTTLGWAPSASYDKNSKFFIYEADEYDRNFLAFNPYISVITCIDYDHPDIYPSIADYQGAFAQFESQSEKVIEQSEDFERFSLVGELRRKNASLVFKLIKALIAEGKITEIEDEKIISVLNSFPGAGRRFENIRKALISDYGHHPKEIAATLEMAQELKERDNYTGIAVIYQPHQNTRQHKMRAAYRNTFDHADKLFWLPTFLTREDPSLEILEPNDFIKDLKFPEKAEAAELNDELIEKVNNLLKQGWLVILFSAGPADSWLRTAFAD